MAVRRTGPGVARLVAALKELDGLQAKTGWFETAKYEDGTPVAYVAAVQEFGNGPIPPRPFMRPTVAAKGPEWMDLLGEGARAILTGGATPVGVLEAVALRAAGDVAETVSEIQSPPLSMLTLAARAKTGPNRRLSGGRELGEAGAMMGPFNVSTKPLVWTGQMIQSVTGVVEPSK